MTRTPASGGRGATKRRPSTHGHRLAHRRIGFRITAAVFGICAVAAVMVGESDVRPGSTAALITDFPYLQSSVKAAIGIAVQPVGGSETPLSLGDWRSGPAWSTIKVPLVIAALREEGPPPHHRSDCRGHNPLG